MFDYFLGSSSAARKIGVYVSLFLNSFSAGSKIDGGFMACYKIRLCGYNGGLVLDWGCNLLSHVITASVGWGCDLKRHMITACVGWGCDLLSHVIITCGFGYDVLTHVIVTCVD